MLALSVVLLVVGYVFRIHVVALLGWCLLGIAVLLILLGAVGVGPSYGWY